MKLFNEIISSLDGECCMCPDCIENLQCDCPMPRVRGHPVFMHRERQSRLFLILDLNVVIFQGSIIAIKASTFW